MLLLKSGHRISKAARAASRAAPASGPAERSNGNGMTKTVGVVGAGMTGSDIAVVFAFGENGKRVTK